MPPPGFVAAGIAKASCSISHFQILDEALDEVTELLYGLISYCTDKNIDQL